LNKTEELELKISIFLRYGVLVAGVLILGGWLMTVKWSADPFFSFQMYGELPLKEIIAIYLRTDNYGMLVSLAGLGCLISLPIIRVLLTAWLFFWQKDFMLAFIAVCVFLGLLASFTLGIEL
jgi:uncharacterized membrane protein